jgi:opacity protein-like surface antigen
MKKMRHNHGLRIALLAGASVVALAASAPSAGAADMNKPMPMKAPPVPVAKDTWTWWIEGGAFNTDGGSFGQFPSIKPNWGGEGAIGFDWNVLPQMHVVGDARFGAASKSNPFHSVVPTGGGTVVTSIGSQSLKEDHWLVDFGIGRDFGLGNSHAEWTLGVRVADLRARLNVNAKTKGLSASGTTVSTGVNAAQERSTFFGVGPRLAAQGDIPLGGQLSIDWLGGVAVLFGERSAQTISTTVNAAGTTQNGAIFTDTPAVLNLEAQAGLSYWFSPTMKITLSYRYDEYFRALKSITLVSATSGTPVLAASNIDRAFNGPMLRLTTKF